MKVEVKKIHMLTRNRKYQLIGMVVSEGANEGLFDWIYNLDHQRVFPINLGTLQ